jgi:phage gp36-like protein
MAYATIADVKNRLPEEWITQLTDDNQTDSIDTEKANDCLRYGQDLIDSYLRGRYSVPLAPGNIPDMIRDMNTHLAIYHLFTRSLVVTVPEPIKLEYEETIKLLKEIQRGKMSPFEVSSNPAWVVSNHGGVGDTRPTILATTTPNNSIAWNRYLI